MPEGMEEEEALTEYLIQTETRFRISDLIARFEGVLASNFKKVDSSNLADVLAQSSDWILQIQNSSLDSSFRYIFSL